MILDMSLVQKVEQLTAERDQLRIELDGEREKRALAETESAMVVNAALEQAAMAIEQSKRAKAAEARLAEVTLHFEASRKLAEKNARRVEVAERCLAEAEKVIAPFAAAGDTLDDNATPTDMAVIFSAHGNHVRLIDLRAAAKFMKDKM